MASTRSPGCRKRCAVSRSWSCSSCVIPIRRPGRWSRNARTAHICCRPARASRWTARALHPTARSKWGEQIVPPVFESKNDYDTMYMLARKLGFADQMFKNIKVENGVVSAEDILREINRGGWSAGYCGQSPERLKAHMRNQAKFDLVTMRAPKD